MRAGFWGLTWEPVGEEWEEVQEEDATDGKRFGCQEAVREIIASRGPTWESRQRLDAAGAEEGDLIVGQDRYFRISDRRRTGHLLVGRAEEGVSSLAETGASCSRSCPRGGGGGKRSVALSGLPDSPH